MEEDKKHSFIHSVMLVEHHRTSPGDTDVNKIVIMGFIYLLRKLFFLPVWSDYLVNI